jgi:hypothetical protein
MEERRDRERDVEAAQQTASELFQLKSLNMKVWRTLSDTERAAFEKLLDSYEGNEDRIELSVVAAQAHNLMPGMGGRNANAKPYVVEYTRAVRDMARYIAMVDRERRAIEQMLGPILSALPAEQQVAAQPVFERIVRALSPSSHLRRLVINSEDPALQAPGN